MTAWLNDKHPKEILRIDNLFKLWFFLSNEVIQTAHTLGIEELETSASAFIKYGLSSFPQQQSLVIPFELGEIGDYADVSLSKDLIKDCGTAKTCSIPSMSFLFATPAGSRASHAENRATQGFRVTSRSRVFSP